MNFKLDKNNAVHASVINLIRRGTAEILEDTEEGVFICDRISDGYYLFSDYETGKEWLMKYSDRAYSQIVVLDERLAEFAEGMLGLSVGLRCYQAYLPDNALPEGKQQLVIRPAKEEDFAIIRANYDPLPDEELMMDIRLGHVFVGELEGKPAGFIGEHLDGAMGLLEIFPENRKMGLGTELEVFMMQYEREKGMIPYCQVMEGNEKSMNLQKKLGMVFSDTLMYWLF